MTIIAPSLFLKRDAAHFHGKGPPCVLDGRCRFFSGSGVVLQLNHSALPSAHHEQAPSTKSTALVI